MFGSTTVSNIVPSSWNLTESVILTSLSVLTGTFLLYKVLGLISQVRKLNVYFKNVPGPTGRHWFYGHLHLFPKLPSERIKFILGLGSKFRRYFCLWVGPARVTVIVNHPTTVKAVMKTSEPKPTSFGGMYRFGLPWLGRGLLIADGARWARSRRLLTPAFHFDILKPYVDIYNEAAEKLMDNLDKYAEGNEDFEVFTNISRCTLDVILRCAFSYETDCQKPGSAHPYLTAVNELSEIWWKREKRLMLYPDFIFYLTPTGRRFKKYCDYVHGVAEEVIKERKKALERSTKPAEGKYLDFLDILLTAKDEEGNGMSLLDIRNEVDTFMFEGHDTTASSISWTLYALAKHPEYQKKAQKEIDEIFSSKDTEEIEWKDLNKLEYLTMCLKESLRNYSPVPFIQREFTHDFEVEGRKFPAGTPVTVHIYGVHHNRDVWEDPMSYKPERFSKENVAKMDSYQFVPFSAGPRNCIGQHFALNEEKVILARLLRRFSFHLDPYHVVQMKIAATLRTETGIRMYCTKRF
ncbi:ultra-long-chain fatty acid omega-hydroxylase-like [Mercenaria mercenaria]|uniref:ultra-long-chain fatty acid omega-hydroxylase-like n=1 Tax=Mercenaria mercenaria TaxID=6596 RepID=UPI00234E3AFD|nr:ultra-long-chain fatty acid omega-hydroxylase-like [Mercenaria mercenaria]